MKKKSEVASQFCILEMSFYGFCHTQNDSSFICGKLRGSEIVVKPRNEFCFVKLQSAKTTVVNIGLECFNLGEDACKVLIRILICGGVKMSKWLGRIAGMFRSGSMVGKDKAGNRYFTRNDEVDGILKEKRWVVFKGEEDPTSVPVEWICWLNGQRKKAPTAEDIGSLSNVKDRRKRRYEKELTQLFLKAIVLNIYFSNCAKVLKKEEEERKAREGTTRKVMNTGKGGPDLKSFIRQFPGSSEGDKHKDETNEMDGVRTSKEKEAVKQEYVYRANRIWSNIQAWDMAATNMK
ncbi:hypothetical protein ACLB2K_029164 [Fragaria x ananassa]